MGAEVIDNFQMQWMLFQEKFGSIDKAFSEVKDRNQEISNSLRDVLNVLESVERVHMSSDKLASEVRARIFNEIDNWIKDRTRTEDLLSDIKTHIKDLGQMLEDHLQASEQGNVKVLKEVQNVSAMLVNIDNVLNKDNRLEKSLNEVTQTIRGMSGSDPKDGIRYGILSREWFIWHWKRGFSAMITTLIVAFFFAFIVPIILYFAPKVEFSKVFGK